jgi:hypothetical protein
MIGQINAVVFRLGLVNLFLAAIAPRRVSVTKEGIGRATCFNAISRKGKGGSTAYVRRTSDTRNSDCGAASGDTVSLSP